MVGSYDRIATGSASIENAAIAEHLVTQYGIKPIELVALPGEIDRNFRVRVPGCDYVLKIAGALSDVSDAELQISVLDHLERHLGTVPAPRPVRTLAGDACSTILTTEGARSARLMTWLEGERLADVSHHPRVVFRQLGATAARVVVALSSFDHPAVVRTHHWDMRTAPEAVRSCLPFIEDTHRAAAAVRLVSTYEEIVGPMFDVLPRAVVHQDLNDFNVLVAHDITGALKIVGILDVGDVLHTVRVAELSVAVAYAMRGKADPLDVAGEVTAGFHEELPLTDDEVRAVFPMAAARLCVNAATWTRRLRDEPQSTYARNRMRNSWELIELLQSIPAVHAEAVLRAACGMSPPEAHRRFSNWLTSNAGAFRPPFVGLDRAIWVDVSAGSHAIETAANVDQYLREEVTRHAFVLSRHGAAHMSRAGRRKSGPSEPATIHLGVDVHAAAGTEVRASLAGFATMLEPHRVCLRHETDQQRTFWSIYDGVEHELSEGQHVEAGQRIGTLAARDLPHVHMQLALWFSREGELPSHFARPSQAAYMTTMSPDPAVFLGLGDAPATSIRVRDVVSLRNEHLATSQRSYYDKPMNLVRANGVWFTDEDSLQYLDSMNNVTHLGHGHPRVVEAVSRQLRRLNTNSRFVYSELALYADRLTSLLPDPLEVLFFVCTGSEANDLALRISRQCTAREQVIVIDGAYHGNTTAVTGISPDRYKKRGGSGPPSTTTEIPTPNRYRGAYGYDRPDAGAAYAADAREIIRRLGDAGRAPAAFIAESLMGTAGQIVHPDGFLAAVFEAVRSAGGLCISDEVQVGFGRLGSRFWGFQTQGVVPDIVTMGKPMGNGFPLSAVVTTREIADAFDTGMKYFNTFGGNPVACAAGMAVLDVLEEENLQEHALDVGGYLKGRLRELMDRHRLIGDVRGEGLYLGIELVRDRDTKEPAREEAFAISERLKEEGVITYPNGTLDNCLKIKPPMVFRREDADLFVDALDEVLTLGW